MMNVWSTVFKARPSPKHPKYWEIQYGYLAVYLLSDSPQEAVESALKIAALLPYDFFNPPDAQGFTSKELTPSGLKRLDDKQSTPEFQLAVDAAKTVGVFVSYFAAPTGADEAEFETVDFSK